MKGTAKTALISGVLKALGYLLLLSVSAIVGTLLVVTARWYRLTDPSEPFWAHLVVAYMLFLVCGLVSAAPIYGLACWRFPVMRRLWVPVTLGLLWMPVHAANPISVNGWKGIASVALTSAVVVAVLLLPAEAVTRGRGVARTGTEESG